MPLGDKIRTDKWGQCLRMCPLLPLYGLPGMSLDENRALRELAACRQEDKASENPTNDCGLVAWHDEIGPKPAPEELIVIVLLPGWVGVGSRAELPVCEGAFRLAAVPVDRNGGRWFLRTVLSSTGRDRECVRFYGRWR